MFSPTSTLMDALIERYGQDAVDAADVIDQGEHDTVYFGSPESVQMWGLTATDGAVEAYKSVTRGIVWTLDRRVATDDPVEHVALELGIIA